MKAIFRTPDRVLLAFVLVVLIPALVYAWAIRPNDLAGNADFTAGQNIKVDSTGTKFETTAAGAGDVTSSMLNAATAASAFTGATNFATNTELTTATAAGTVSGTSIDWTSGITLPFIASISSAASAFLTGVTPTYVNTLTSNLQVQLNSKVSSSALNAASFIGTTDFATDASLNAATAAAAFTGTTDFATDASLNAATAAAAFTGTTDFVTVGELTLVTAAATTSGTSIDWTSGVTLPRLSGVTDNVQTQINTARGLIGTGGSGDFKADGTVPMTGNFLPGPANSLTLGSGTSTFGDLFLGSGGVINFDNGDVTITHGANALTIAGASGVTITGELSAGASGCTIDADGDVTAKSFTTAASSDPTMTLQDSDAATGSGKIFANSSGGAYNVVLQIGVEDGVAESVPYIVISGTTRAIELTKPLVIYSGNTDPPLLTGAIVHDSTVAGYDHGALKWYSGVSTLQVVSFDTSRDACTSTQVVSYDADKDVFYCKDDATIGGDGVTQAQLNAHTAAGTTSGTSIFSSYSDYMLIYTGAAWDDLPWVGDISVGIETGVGIKASLASGVTATVIADGSVDNTEFQYLSGVTEAIQTQINAARGAIVAAGGDFYADGSVPMTGNFLPGPTNSLNIGSSTSSFAVAYINRIETSGVTDPSITLEDSDNATGTAKFYGNSSGGANDVTLYIGVEDSAGESTNYIVVSGVTEIVEILKALKASGVTTHNGSTGAGFIHIMEDADNGTDYASIVGGANMGAYPTFHFSGSQGGSTLSLSNSLAGWTVDASGSTVVITPNVGMSGNLAVTGQASGGAKTYSILSGVTNATQLNDVTGASTLLAAEVQGTLINIDSSGVTRFTLPTPASGYNTIFTVLVSGVTVQVESGTTMYVNGTATATNGVGAQIVSVTVGEYISCWTANVPNIGDGNGHGEIEWFCRKVED